MKTDREIYKWLRANFGKNATAALSSHDANALCASLALTPLISWSGAGDQLFAAYRAIVMEMQPHTRWLAYHLIAMELDWGHRQMIWERADLPISELPKRLAAFEPDGVRRDLSREVM